MQTILSRRAVRAWLAKSIPAETLVKVLEAGRRAPSPLNSQPWHFTVVRRPATLCELASRARHGAFLPKADAAIIVSVCKRAKVDEWLSEHEQHIYSGVCAMQNMWLAAWDVGLGACWVTVDERKTKRLLGIPSNHKILGGIALGYPERSDSLRASNRLPLSNMVSFESFGTKGDFR